MQPGLKRRARRALERQLDYQRRKAQRVQGHEAELIASMIEHSRQVRSTLEQFGPVPRERART